MNIDGSEQVRLTDNPARDFYSSYSPDGSKIAFASDRNGNAEGIYIMNIDGSGQKILTEVDIWDFVVSIRKVLKE